MSIDVASPSQIAYRKNIDLVQLLLSKNFSIDHAAEMMTDGYCSADKSRRQSVTYWRSRILRLVELGVVRA